MVFMRTANQLAERRCSSGWGRAAAGSRIDRWSVIRRKEGRCRDGAWGASGQRNHGFQIGKMNSDCLRTLIGEAVDAAGARDGEEDAGVAGEEAASGGGVKLQGKWKAMNQTPRATARLVREVTGMPTTPNMWSTPARERALAIRTLPSIVGGCELWEFGASVLVSTIVVVKVFKQCDRRRESEVSKFGFVRRAAKARLPPAGEAELLSS